MQSVFSKSHILQTSWLPIFDKVMAEDLSWQRILYNFSTQLLKFLLNLRSNTLPSPDNLVRWSCNVHARCGLCNKRKATLAHLMNFCPWVRSQNKLGKQDRYTWRHNSVLCVLINFLSKYILDEKNEVVPQRPKQIKFLKPGTRRNTAPQKKTHNGVFSNAKDWKLFFDLPEANGEKQTGYTMPHNIVISPLKVDLLIFSESLKYAFFVN